MLSHIVDCLVAFAALLAILDYFGIKKEHALWGLRMPLNRAWKLAIMLCLVAASLGMSGYSFYRAYRPKINVVEKLVPVEKIAQKDCPLTVVKPKPPKPTSVKKPIVPAPPAPTISQAGNNNGAVGGNVNQGPCSNLGIGGNDNQQNTNCTFQDNPPQVLWSHTQDDQNHAVKLKIWVNKPFQAAMFAVTCDRPCEGVSGEMDYAGRAPKVVFGPEVRWGHPNNPPILNVVGFIVDFPAVLPPDYSVLATVKSADGQPLQVRTVGRLTLTGAH